MHRKANAKRLKATVEWEKAVADCQKAKAEWRGTIKVLHAKECPDCPWDGGSIFPQEVAHA